MSRKSITLKLSEAELDQLRQYVHERDCGENAGWYYGNRKQFEKRHAYLGNILSDACGVFNLPTGVKA